MPKKTDDLDKNEDEDEDEDDTEDAPVVSPECMKYCQEETFSESGLRACAAQLAARFPSLNSSFPRQCRRLDRWDT